MVLWRTSSSAAPTPAPSGGGGSDGPSSSAQQSHAGGDGNLTGGGESSARERGSDPPPRDERTAGSAPDPPSATGSGKGAGSGSSSDPDGGGGGGSDRRRAGGGQRKQDGRDGPRPRDGGRRGQQSGMGPPTQPLFPPFTRDGRPSYGSGYGPGNNSGGVGGGGGGTTVHPPPAPHLWPPGNSHQEKKKMKRDRMGNARPSSGGTRERGGSSGSMGAVHAQRVDVYPDGSGFVTNADGTRTFSRGSSTTLPLAATMAGQAGGLSGSGHSLPGGYGFNPPGSGSGQGGGSAPSSPMFSFAGPQAPDPAGSFGGFGGGGQRAMAAVGAPSPMMPADAGVQGMGGGQQGGGGNGGNNGYPYNFSGGQGMNIHQQTISNALGGNGGGGGGGNMRNSGGGGHAPLQPRMGGMAPLPLSGMNPLPLSNSMSGGGSAHAMAGGGGGSHAGGPVGGGRYGPQLPGPYGHHHHNLGPMANPHWSPQGVTSTCEFTHVIGDYSSKRDSGCKKAEYSDITTDGHGNKWRLIIYVNGNGRASNHHLSLFLQVADAESLPFGWNKSVSYVLTLEHPTTGQTGAGGVVGYSKRNPDKMFKLCPKAIDWGWSQFITSDRIQSEGYIQDDTLVVKASVSVKHSSIQIDPEDSELYLKCAVEEGNAPGVLTCLSQGASVNCQFKDDLYSPLHTACSASTNSGEVNSSSSSPTNSSNGTPGPFPPGSVDVLHLLLERGADVNACNKWSETPLLIAANNGHVDAVRALLKSGADPSLCSEAGWSALTFAAHKGYDDICQLLLDADAPVNCRVSEDLSTPLHKACAGGKPGHSACVAQLLRGDADVHALNKWRETPLLTAANHGQHDSVAELLEFGADPCKCTDTGWSPLSIAAYKGHDECVKLLLEEGAPTEEDDPTLSALLQAATKGLPDTCVLLLRNGADHTVTTKKGDTALSILVEQNMIDAAVEMVTDFSASIPRCSRDRKKVQRARLLINLRLKQMQRDGTGPYSEDTDTDEGESDSDDQSDYSSHSGRALHDNDADSGAGVSPLGVAERRKRKKKKGGSGSGGSKSIAKQEEEARAAEEALLLELEAEEKKQQATNNEISKNGKKKRKKKERERQLKAERAREEEAARERARREAEEAERKKKLEAEEKARRAAEEEARAAAPPMKEKVVELSAATSGSKGKKGKDGSSPTARQQQRNGTSSGAQAGGKSSGQPSSKGKQQQPPSSSSSEPKSGRSSKGRSAKSDGGGKQKSASSGGSSTSSSTTSGNAAKGSSGKKVPGDNPVRRVPGDNPVVQPRKIPGDNPVPPRRIPGDNPVQPRKAAAALPVQQSAAARLPQPKPAAPRSKRGWESKNPTPAEMVSKETKSKSQQQPAKQAAAAGGKGQQTAQPPAAVAAKVTAKPKEKKPRKKKAASTATAGAATGQQQPQAQQVPAPAAAPAPSADQAASSSPPSSSSPGRKGKGSDEQSAANPPTAAADSLPLTPTALKSRPSSSLSNATPVPAAPPAPAAPSSAPPSVRTDVSQATADPANVSVDDQLANMANDVLGFLDFDTGGQSAPQQQQQQRRQEQQIAAVGGGVHHSPVPSGAAGGTVAHSPARGHHQQQAAPSAAQGPAHAPRPSVVAVELPSVSLFRLEKLNELFHRCQDARSAPPASPPNPLSVIDERTLRVVLYRWIIRASHGSESFADPVIPSWTDGAYLREFLQRQLISESRRAAPSGGSGEQRGPSIEALRDAGSAMSEVCTSLAAEVADFRSKCEAQVPPGWGDGSIGVSGAEDGTGNVVIDWSGKSRFGLPYPAFDALARRYVGPRDRLMSAVFSAARRHEILGAIADGTGMLCHVPTRTVEGVSSALGATLQTFSDAVSVSGGSYFCGVFPDVDAAFGGLAPFGREKDGGEAVLAQGGGSVVVLAPPENATASQVVRRIVDMSSSPELSAPLSFGIVLSADCFVGVTAAGLGADSLRALDPRLCGERRDLISFVEGIPAGCGTVSPGSSSMLLLVQNEAGRAAYPPHAGAIEAVRAAARNDVVVVSSSASSAVGSVAGHASVNSGESSGAAAPQHPSHLGGVHGSVAGMSVGVPVGVVAERQYPTHVDASSSFSPAHRHHHQQQHAAAARQYPQEATLSSNPWEDDDPNDLRTSGHRGRLFELEGGAVDDEMHNLLPGMFDSLGMNMFGNSNGTSGNGTGDIDIEAISLLGMGLGPLTDGGGGVNRQS